MNVDKKKDKKNDKNFNSIILNTLLFPSILNFQNLRRYINLMEIFLCFITKSLIKHTNDMLYIRASLCEIQIQALIAS